MNVEEFKVDASISVYQESINTENNPQFYKIERVKKEIFFELE